MLLVDAANVVGSRPTGWWRDRPGAARRLVERLRAASASGTLRPPVAVVLEGAARAGAEEGERDGVRVVHAPGSGDDTLAALAAATTGPVVLVTADRELRRRAARPGLEAIGPGALLERLDAHAGTAPDPDPPAAARPPARRRPGGRPVTRPGGQGAPQGKA